MLAGNWLWIILGALVAVGLGGSYVKGRSDGRALEFAERATMDEVARVAREAAIQAAGEKIASIKVTQTTIRQKAEVITRENILYRDCRNDPAVVSLLDAARENRPPTERTGSSELPGTGASPSPDIR